jgi:hypothetical protein
MRGRESGARTQAKAYRWKRLPARRRFAGRVAEQQEAGRSTFQRMGMLRHGLVAVALASMGCASSSSGPAFAKMGDDGAPPDDADLAEGSTAVDASESPDAPTSFSSPDGNGGPLACQPGTYAGTYMGTFQGIPITGPITITLVPDTELRGEIALVTNGATFDETWGLTAGDATAPIVVTHATLQGQLDCTNGMFDATSPDAMFTIAGVPSGMSMLDFSGTYDAASATIAGPFTTTSMLGNSMGTWLVTRMP